MSSAGAQRVYIGSLAPSVNEFALLQLCRPHGRIMSIQLPTHRDGPHRGKSKGFAFVQYSTAQEALNAVLNLHDKLLHGRKITAEPAKESSAGAHSKPRKPAPTTAISLEKTSHQPKSTDAKIAALEAKLGSMRGQEEQTLDALPAKHPSLPAKPIM